MLMLLIGFILFCLAILFAVIGGMELYHKRKYPHLTQEKSAGCGGYMFYIGITIILIIVVLVIRG